ncbi:MAG: D-alanyl-D-alanine carboxypeptidase family protein, partial [Fimbriimonadaceae bacterium]
MLRGLFLALLLLPGMAVAVPDLPEPDIDSASAIIMETRTGKVLYALNPDTVRYPASTTKIMTALLLIENADLDDMITAPSDIEKVGGSSMDLKPGERVSVEDMLYALLLRSANDGAHATAVHVAGSVSAFSDMMDERAKELGATKTDFNNPHGLNDDKHTTTARDLALIAKGAMENATFASIARTTRRVIRRSVNVDETIMESRNKLLTEYSGNLGIKTGWTRPAGRCFVGAFNKGGYGIVTVVLKSGDWLGDTRELADWAYGNYELARVIPENEVVGELPAERG